VGQTSWRECAAKLSEGVPSFRLVVRGETFGDEIAVGCAK